MPCSLASSALIALTACCLFHPGQAGAATQAHAASASSSTSMQEVLAIDDTRLNWRHNDQILELVASSDGLLVTQASASLSLQLQRGDRVRTAGRTEITTVATLLAALRAAAGNPVAVDVMRDGVQVHLIWTAATYTPLLPPAAP
ncbi:putative uncharacterized protein [Xanthomonas citri pv. punicae str. LMG 859]|nr:hypothetical protein FICKIIDM_02722 [Xanthomonas citri pv. punicae]CCF67427.1 putative uncharacterized protein [Xanthomonas citri pv. punicae str. LMG 859]